MISVGVHILTEQDLEKVRAACFKKGYARGMIEAREEMRQAQDTAKAEPSGQVLDGTGGIPELEEPMQAVSVPAVRRPIAAAAPAAPWRPNLVGEFKPDVDSRESTFRET